VKCFEEKSAIILKKLIDAIIKHFLYLILLFIRKMNHLVE